MIDRVEPECVGSRTYAACKSDFRQQVCLAEMDYGS